MLFRLPINDSIPYNYPEISTLSNDPAHYLRKSVLEMAEMKGTPLFRFALTSEADNALSAKSCVSGKAFDKQ